MKLIFFAGLLKGSFIAKPFYNIPVYTIKMDEEQKVIEQEAEKDSNEVLKEYYENEAD